MILTKDNIKEWKQSLDKLMSDYVPKDEKYSDCNSDETWIDMYEGESIEKVKDDDLFYSSQN